MMVCQTHPVPRLHRRLLFHREVRRVHWRYRGIDRQSHCHYGTAENSAVSFESDGPVSIEFDFFCGVRHYVALTCGAVIKTHRTHFRGYIIPLEGLSHAEV